MSDTFLKDISVLDISSVTDPRSLFLYVVNSGTSNKVSAHDMSAAVLGGIKHFATISTNSFDLASDVMTPVVWTDTKSDTFGLVDSNSATLFRIPDDTISHVQLLMQARWESYLGTNGGTDLMIRGGGLPDPWFNMRDRWFWTGNKVSMHQPITPVTRVSSGSYFWVEVRQSHSVARIFGSGDKQDTMFSIWCW
jgi:hypothetical protein